ncbi:SpoIIE family protein phosphatase [Streptomyces sp. NPDC005962]|uniref:SpoIIE family protein phosphatase n=1 Tax=Streptomyces sp. NPDC005962 TaxID=3154466 RepID=UPI0033EF0900
MDDTRDTARWATMVLDAAGAVVRWSAGAEWLLGYSPADVLGRAAAELLWDGQGSLPGAARRSLAGREPWSGHVRARHRDGGPFEVELLACPLRDSDGTAQWLLAAMTAPEGAHRGVAVTERSFTQGDWPMAIHDTELRLLRANARMCRVTGLPEDEMRGRRSGFLAGNPVNEQVETAMRKAIRTGEAEHAQTLTRAAGETRDQAWAVSLSPLTDETGRVCAVAAAGLDISELYRTRERLALLNEASIQIGTTLDVTRTAQELASMPLPRFADFISVDLLDSVLRGDEPTPGPVSGDVRLRRVAHESAHAKNAPEAAVGIGETDTYPEFSPPARCLATGRAVLTGPWDTDYFRWMDRDPKRNAKRTDFGVQSLVAAPLVARGNTLGAALFSRRLHPDTFTEDDLILAEQLAARAAVCIDNARRYTRERGTAVALQRSLLPQGLPAQSAVEFATRYLPADSRYGVGGDWFDVIPLSGARVALVVGDVVGHGIHASATMGRLRTAVRTLADIDLPPDELLTHLDDVVGRLASEGTEPVDYDVIGASCLYAVYDPVSRLCCAARAGHPPPALVAPDGTVEFCEVPAGPPLGLGDLPFESAEIGIPEGALLVLYTDGLVESRDRDIGSGMDGLREVLGEPSRGAVSLEATCDTVLRALLSDRPADDVALLVARARALDAGQVVTWELPAEPALVAEARERAAAQLAAWGLAELTFTTEMVVSELFTNAILHGQGPVQLRLIRDRTLICEVSDTSTTAPHMRRARVFDEGGRGLLLVAQLSGRWGTRQTPTGKIIWAEQALPA